MEHREADAELFELSEAVDVRKARQAMKQTLVGGRGETAVAVDQRREVRERVQHIARVPSRRGDVVTRIRNRKDNDRIGRGALGEPRVHR